MKKLHTTPYSSGSGLQAAAKNLLEHGSRACLVCIEKADGSTPRDAGTIMLVSDSEFWGTIGGGRLEYLALENAREFLCGSTTETWYRTVSLGPEINQCCGGRVELSFRLLTEKNAALIRQMQDRALPKVQIHGAGHTGTALAEALALLPLEVALIDSRPEMLRKTNTPANTEATGLPEHAVRNADPGTGFVVLTHSHDLDFLITAEALARKDAAYVGMIGSATKRAVFTKWLAANGHDATLAGNLVCPIGGTAVRDKRPEVIAAMVAAELMQVFFGQVTAMQDDC